MRPRGDSACAQSPCTPTRTPAACMSRSPTRRCGSGLRPRAKATSAATSSCKPRGTPVPRRSTRATASSPRTSRSRRPAPTPASRSSGRQPFAIHAMGSKSEAKALMERAKVPLVPGYHGEQQEHRFLQAQADAIGYPVLIKASAGGGGKGMRVVKASGDFEAALVIVPARSQGLVRRRPRPDREVRRAAAARRDPGVRRRIRQRGVPVRARLLGAAPPSEGDRGGPGPGHDAGTAQRDGRSGCRRRQGGRLCRRRHRRVHRRSRRATSSSWR